MPGAINNYLNSLARRLHLDPKREREILEELQGHIEDKAAEMEADGLDRESALACAVEEMGAPRVIASRMYAVHSTGRCVARCGSGHGAPLPPRGPVRPAPLEPLLPGVRGAGGHRLRHLAQLAQRWAEPVVLHLAGIHPGGSSHFVAPLPGCTGVRRVDAGYRRPASLQHRIVLHSCRVCPVLDVDRVQRGVQDCQAGLAPGLVDSASLPFLDIMGAVPELVGRTLERSRGEDAADRHGTGLHLPGTGGHDRRVPQGRARA